MKKACLIFLTCFTIFCCFSQSNNSKPGSAIPSFKMALTNGTYYTDKQIPKNKPFVLIYFAPDCDHCIKLMDELFKKIHQLDNATIVMITFEQIKDVAWFERKYNIGQFANIKVGTEGITYLLRKYYKLEKTPFTAVYDKHGKLAFSYKDETPVAKMLSQFKKL